MPIRPDLRHFYAGPVWRAISRFVRFERARGSCEACGRKHGQRVYSLPDGRFCDDGSNWLFEDGSRAPHPTLLDWRDVSAVTVYLQTAHKNHDPSDSSDANLAAWCQRCHLDHDRQQHLRNRVLNSRVRKAEERAQNALRDLF